VHERDGAVVRGDRVEVTVDDPDLNFSSASETCDAEIADRFLEDL